MGPSLKLKGIYDHRTLELAGDLGVGCLGLDFRPLSLSFLQTHILREMLSSMVQTDLGLPRQLALQFAKDKDFVIESLIQVFHDVLADRLIGTQLVLELSQEVPAGIAAVMAKFQIPVWWQVSELQQLQALSDQKGLIIAHSLIEDLYQRQQYKGLETLAKQIDHSFAHRPQIELACTWESVPLSAVQEILRPDILSVAVSPAVELNYRNVDLMRLHRFLGLFAHQWGLSARSKSADQEHHN